MPSEVSPLQAGEIIPQCGCTVYLYAEKLDDISVSGRPLDGLEDCIVEVWPERQGLVRVTLALVAGDRVRIISESKVSTNVYTCQFIANCPNNGLSIQYTLTIRAEGRVIPVEQIVLATEAIRVGYHEAIADQLLNQFGGRQTLVAHHHGVGIETIRGVA